LFLALEGVKELAKFKLLSLFTRLSDFFNERGILMRILITGGAGFLGSHLCEFLLDEGHEVICMDNLVTGSLENVKALFGNEKFLFTNQDVTNYIHISGKLDAVLLWKRSEGFAGRVACVSPSFSGLTGLRLARNLGAGSPGEPQRSLALARAVRSELRRAVPAWRRLLGRAQPFVWWRVR
jgi:hypothetical protein